MRWQTTTDLTPKQIHEIGLSEVKRIRAEMDKVIASVNFKGSFHDFTEFLRTDPRFYYDKPDDLVNGYRIIAKRIDPELAHEFGKLPRLPYGVCAIPDFKAPSQTTAYYQLGFAGGGAAGLLLREHLQSACAAEVGDGSAVAARSRCRGIICRFRWRRSWKMCRNSGSMSGYSAFVEGWALYWREPGRRTGIAARIRTRNSGS